MSVLEKSILGTLAWFDLQQYPLTFWECWYYLYNFSEAITATPNEVIKALHNLKLQGLVRSDFGFWQLQKSPSYLNLRLERSRLALVKRKKAFRAARILSYVPFVRMVAFGNTLAFDAAKKDSDIDLLIVLKNGRMFLGRLFVTLVLQLRGWRRHHAKVANRLCLSFYLTEDNLNLRHVSYAKDPYMVFWVASLVPLWGDELYKKFVLANAWIGDFLPNWQSSMRDLVGGFQVGRQASISGNLVRRFGEIVFSGSFGRWCEKAACKFELALIKSHKNSRLGDGTMAVVVSDKILKFHESDQRPELTKSFERHLASVLSSML